MTNSLLLFFTRPETKLWGTVVILIIAGLGYLASRITRGYVTGYLKSSISDRLKTALAYIHGGGSLILALALPNNYLNEVEFFKALYLENELWIAASIVILLFLSLIALGAVFTFVTRGKGNALDS